MEYGRKPQGLCLVSLRTKETVDCSISFTAKLAKIQISRPILDL